MALHRSSRGWLAGALVAVATLSTLPASRLALAADEAASPLPPYLAKQPAFNPQITSALPGDIDIPLQKSLEQQGKFAQVQREFDLNAWQMFLGLNWPVEASGQPKKSLTDPGSPRWSRWTQSFLVFRSDGKRPTMCGGGANLAAAESASPPTNETLSVSRGLPPLRELMKGVAGSDAAMVQSSETPRRVLGTISSVGELNAAKLSEIDQAFSVPLVDQNGQLVFYEIILDPNEVGYICSTSLYNINGQVDFAKTGTVKMPWGVAGKDGSGAFEVKLAWKILQGKDDLSRFYHEPATVIDVSPDGKPLPRNVTVGLVGMHIAHKSVSSPQWIWATFEQVDNIDVDALAHPMLNPSFTNPGCPSCAVNVPTVVNKNGSVVRTPTQVARVIPIPGDKVALNREAQAALKGLGSIWQYYQLIDTQWPTNPGAAPTPPSAGAPGAVDNKAGGNPTPVFLTNATMETFFQAGNQPVCGQEESCVPTAPGPQTVFGTESCMGCHSSAGIFKSYDPSDGTGVTTGQLTADFTWLPAQKACWAGSGTPGNGQNCGP